MTRKRSRLLSVLFILYALPYTLSSVFPPPARALELSLEENKGESGTVGFVDIDRVFKDYSGTLTAREEFLKEIKKKEESVNQRKRAVFTLKADISKLKQEREFALTLPSLFATAEQVNRGATAAETPAVEPSSAPAAAQDAVQGTEDKAAETAVSTETAAALQVSTGSAAAPEVSTSAIKIPPGGLPGIDMPGIAKVPVSYFKFSVSTAIPEIDAAISSKEAELREKEEALRLYQRQMEKELLEYESHRSELLLGRIYLKLKELAVREGVSVIVDKRSILFGHSAVELTDKLLAALEEGQ